VRLLSCTLTVLLVTNRPRRSRHLGAVNRISRSQEISDNRRRSVSSWKRPIVTPFRAERPARLLEHTWHDQGDVQPFGWIPQPWRSTTCYDVKFQTLSTNSGGRDSMRRQHQPCRLAWVRSYFLLSRNLTVWLICIASLAQR